MRESEKRAAERVKIFLEENGHSVSFESGSDPPDIVFDVDNSKWAVEHTQLHQYVDSEGNDLSGLGVHSVAYDIKERLKKKTDGKRKSSWVLGIIGPLNTKQRSLIEEAAEKSILHDSIDYFADISEKQAILERKSNGCKTIEVISALSGSSQIPNSNHPTANIQAPIDYTIECILKEKAPILKALTNYDKRVLLIESQYIFARQDNVSQSIQTYCDLADCIELIYLVTPGLVDIIK
jgi:hypothetical protein